MQKDFLGKYMDKLTDDEAALGDRILMVIFGVPLAIVFVYMLAWLYNLCNLLFFKV